eukprot:scaffold1439_cov404-Prasinococcus_capsulatus_cf.AAC.1
MPACIWAPGPSRRGPPRGLNRRLKESLITPNTVYMPIFGSSTAPVRRLPAPRRGGRGAGA